MSDTRLAWFRARHRKQGVTDWMTDALCRIEKVPTETFYSATSQAREVCDRCPVAYDCRKHAFETEEKYGIWGGVSFADWYHPQHTDRLEGLNDPRIREAYRRVWSRSGEGSETRKHLRRLSDPELELLAAQEDFI